MKIEPKVDEYWYFANYNNSIYIGKVVAIDERCVVKCVIFRYNQICYSPVGMQYTRIDINNVIGKWEPNLFFRLLGYK